MTQRLAETRVGLHHARERVGAKASMLLLASIALAGCTTSEPNTQPEQRYDAVYAVDDAATLDGTMCPPPNAQAMQKVTELYTAADDAMSTGYDPNAKIETIDQVAARYSLTLHNFNDSLVNLRFDSQSGNDHIPFSSYLTVMNDFTNKFGIDVVVGAEGLEILHSKDRALTKKELSSEDTKYSFVSIADGLFEMPEEFIRSIGIKKIVLLKIEHGTKTTENISAYVNVANPETIYVDPTAYFTGQDLRHEIFHAWAAKVCGPVDMLIDEAFDALNPQDVYEDYRYSENRVGAAGNYVSREEIEGRLGTLESKAYVAQLNGNTAKQVKIEKMIAALKALVIADDAYGLTEVAEDQATIGEDILSPYSATPLLDPEQPILREKTLLLMSRLYEYMPALVEFNAEIGAVGSDAN